jgi:hypothetical protein
MNSSPNRASGPAERPRRKDVVFDLTTARRMLPLVRRIVQDIQSSCEQLTRLQPEQDRLDRHRRDLSWPERQRRYAVREEIAATERNLNDTIRELRHLGVSLVTREDGEVGFPTQINGRRASFLWKCGEADVSHWSYDGEEARRAIPADWLDGPTGRPTRR